MKRFTLVSMKNLIRVLVFVLAASFIISACSSDDNSSNTNTNTNCGMSFNLDGSAWCGTGYYILVSNTVLTLSGISSGVGTATVGIPNYTGPGTYNSQILASYYDAKTKLTYVQKDAVLTITKNDGTNIEATFSFTGVSTSDTSKTISVTNGKFNGKKQN